MVEKWHKFLAYFTMFGAFVYYPIYSMWTESSMGLPTGYMGDELKIFYAFLLFFICLVYYTINLRMKFPKRISHLSLLFLFFSIPMIISMILNKYSVYGNLLWNIFDLSQFWFIAGILSAYNLSGYKPYTESKLSKVISIILSAIVILLLICVLIFLFLGLL